MTIYDRVLRIFEFMGKAREGQTYSNRVLHISDTALELVEMKFRSVYNREQHLSTR